MLRRLNLSDFAWDPKKNKHNHRKHGIRFEQALEMWLDSNLVVLRSRKTVSGEVRYLNIGIISGKIWVAITSSRSGTIRIISVRRARKSEEKLYEE
jgi:uncharacterized protein